MRRPLGFGGAAAAAAAAASLTLGEFRAGQLSLFLTLAVLAVSLDLVWGYSGILSLGQLLPFGIAAYTTARVATAAPSLSLPGLLLAAAVGAAVAYGVGIAAFRRRPTPVVVGLLTLVLSLTLEQIAKQWRDVTGGFNGLTDVPRITVFGSELPDRAQDLFISVVAVAVITAVGLLVTRPVGAVLIGIRDNERRTEALGYDTVAVKVWIFTIGGAVAGLAGALYVHRTGFVSPQIFGFTLATNRCAVDARRRARNDHRARHRLTGDQLRLGHPRGCLVAVLDARHWGDLRRGGGARSRRACPQRAAYRPAGPPGAAGAPNSWQLSPTRPLATAMRSSTPLLTAMRSSRPLLTAMRSSTPLLTAMRSSRPLLTAMRSSTPLLTANAIFEAATDGNAIFEAATDGNAIFEAAGVAKSFGFFRVLDGVNLAMDEPELRCLIGPNGAGKSTLLDILCGQQGCQDGSIAMLGRDCKGLRAWEFARHGVSRKFQSPQIIGSLSVAENIAVAAWGVAPSPWRLTRRGWEASVPQVSLRILERTGLDDLLDSSRGRSLPRRQAVVGDHHGDGGTMPRPAARRADSWHDRLGEPGCGRTPA